MSIKIYNGYKIEGKSILDLHKELLAFGKVLRAKADVLCAQIMAKELSNVIDHKTLGKFVPDKEYEKNRDVLSNIRGDIFIKLEKLTKERYREPSLDFAFNLVLFPQKKNSFLSIIYTECKEFYDLFEKLGFTPFEYYDNTDQPKGITDKEWSQRRDIWEKTLGGDFYGIPSQCGFSLELIEEGYFQDHYDSLSSILKQVPSLENRANDMAYNLVLHNRLSAYKTFDEQLRVMFDISHNLKKTPEGKKAVEEEKVNIIGKLHPVITKELALSKIEDICEKL